MTGNAAGACRGCGATVKPDGWCRECGDRQAVSVVWTPELSAEVRLRVRERWGATAVDLPDEAFDLRPDGHVYVWTGLAFPLHFLYDPAADTLSGGV